MEKEWTSDKSLTMSVTLSSGARVLAKVYKGAPSAKTFANRTQAENAARIAGDGWVVARWGRPFYVCRIDQPMPAYTRAEGGQG
jgi:hypothetical protein